MVFSKKSFWAKVVASRFKATGVLILKVAGDGETVLICFLPLLTIKFTRMATGYVYRVSWYATTFLHRKFRLAPVSWLLMGSHINYSERFFDGCRAGIFHAGAWLRVFRAVLRQGTIP
jgi:hypothetical protein